MSEALKQIMAERDLSRAITALYLEVDESIVNDIRIKVDAAFQSVRDERDRLRAALEVAGDDICSEFCGSGPCHKKCLAVKAALTPAGGG